MAVMGPTASGKSAAAEAAAERMDAVLINADASQVYRGMDIGTAKPQDRSRYRLLDLVDPSQPFGVGRWVREAATVLEACFAEGRDAIVVGGTGLYVRALFEGYDELDEAPDPALRASIDGWLAAEGVGGLADRLVTVAPERAATTDLKNPRRVQRALERALHPSPSPPVKLPDFRKLKVAIVPDPEENDAAIVKRTREMSHNGWIPEVQRLADRGFGPGDPGFRAHGYRALHRYLRGEVGLEEVITLTTTEVRQYARRQRTWLRSEPSLIRHDSGVDATRAIVAAWDDTFTWARQSISRTCS